MDILYVKQFEYDTGEAAYPLIMDLASDFCKRTGNEKLPDESKVKIRRKKPAGALSGDGKPCFDGLDIHFSVSHSEDIWMCLFSEENCGVDIEFTDDKDHTKLLKKYFGSTNNDIFFDLWVRREAYGKYLGSGIFGVKETLENEGRPRDTIPGEDGDELIFHEIRKEDLSSAGADLSGKDLRCVTISHTKERPEIIMI